MTQNVGLAEAAVPVLRECGVIGGRTFEPEPAKAALGQVEADFLAQPPLGTDAVRITDQQCPDHQLRIDRRAQRARDTFEKGTPALTRVGDEGQQFLLLAQLSVHRCGGRGAVGGTLLP